MGDTDTQGVAALSLGWYEFAPLGRQQAALRAELCYFTPALAAASGGATLPASDRTIVYCVAERIIFPSGPACPRGSAEFTDGRLPASQVRRGGVGLCGGDAGGVAHESRELTRRRFPTPKIFQKKLSDYPSCGHYLIDAPAR